MPQVQGFSAMADVEVAHFLLDATGIMLLPAAHTTATGDLFEQGIPPGRDNCSEGGGRSLRQFSLDHVHGTQEAQPIRIEPARRCRSWLS